MEILKICRFCLLALLLTGACAEADKRSLTPLNRDTVAADTSGILDAIEKLGDLAYDFPEKVVQNPDSLLATLPALPVENEGRQLYAWLLLNMAYALREHGKLPLSISYYERAMSYVQEYKLQEPDLLIYILKPLGNLYTQIADLEKAERIHLLALRLAAARKDNKTRASLYLNLAIVYQQTGQVDSLIRTSRAALRVLPAKDKRNALVCENLAAAFQQQGAEDSTRFYNQKALDVFGKTIPRGDTLLWYGSALSRYSLLESEAGRPGSALHTMQQLIGRVEKEFPGTKRREKAKYYQVLGNLEKRAGKMERARQAYRKSLLLFGGNRQNVPDYTFTEVLWESARLFATSGERDSAICYYALAAENAYHTQQLITSKESSYQNSEWSRGIAREALEQLHNAYTETTEAERRQQLVRLMFRVVELSKGRQLLQEVYRSERWSENSRTEKKRRQLQFLYSGMDAETDLSARQRIQQQIDKTTLELQLSESYYQNDFQAPPMHDFDSLMQVLSWKSCLLSYFLPRRGAAYVIRLEAGKYSYERLDRLQPPHLDEFIGDYFRSGPEAYEKDPDLYARRSEEILDHILPFHKDIRAGQILISPDGPLHSFPFEACVHNGQYLLQEKQIAYTPTFLLQHKYTKVPPVRSGISCFTRSEYSGRLPDLPFVEKERKLLEKEFGARSWPSEDINDSLFFSALGKKDILHIAAHAVADTRAYPYIAFPKPLTLDKIHYASTGSPLVVLSACNTANGKMITAEGLESLHKAFLSKGVRGVVASHWPVDDASVSYLVRDFYAALQESRSPARALTAAKRKFLGKAESHQRNPWYWASLQFSGVDTEIILIPGNPIRHFFWEGFLTMGCLSIFIFFWKKKRRIFHFLKNR